MRRSRLILTTAYGPQVIDVEVVATPSERYAGLSGRLSVPLGTGMLFLFERPEDVRICMRDMLVPIDVVLLDARGVVRYVETMFPGETRTVGPLPPAVAALELGAGDATRLGLRIGDGAILLE